MIEMPEPDRGIIARKAEIVRKFADYVLVMKSGDVVEQGVAEEVFSRPSALYTRQLIASSPVPDPMRQAERRTARTLVHGVV